MEENCRRFKIHEYSVGETSLEQIFIQFARDQKENSFEESFNRI